MYSVLFGSVLRMGATSMKRVDEIRRIRDIANHFMSRSTKHNVFECRCGLCTGGETDDDLLSGVCYDARLFDRIACRVLDAVDEYSSLKGCFRIIATFTDNQNSLVFTSILGDHGELETYDDALSCTRYLMQDLRSEVDSYLITYREHVDDVLEDDYGLSLFSNDGMSWRAVF